MSALETVAAVLLAAGCFFFLAGTAGLLRFPDSFSRMHALTKADNLGLGCFALAAMLSFGSTWLSLKIVLIWLVALLGSATCAFLVARRAHRQANGLPEP